MILDLVVDLIEWHYRLSALYYIIYPHQVDGIRIHVIMNYDYKVAGSEDPL